MPKLRIRVYKLTFSMSFGIYMFCRNKYENSPKYAIKKAYSSKIEAKPNQTAELGQNTSVGAIQA